MIIGEFLLRPLQDMLGINYVHRILKICLKWNYQSFSHLKELTKISTQSFSIYFFSHFESNSSFIAIVQTMHVSSRYHSNKIIDYSNLCREYRGVPFIFFK